MWIWQLKERMSRGQQRDSQIEDSGYRQVNPTSFDRPLLLLGVGLGTVHIVQVDLAVWINL